MFLYNFSGITCRPSRVTKGTQTESASQPVIVPVMVPIYLPVPMQMYQRPLPVPVPMPLPIPGNYQFFPLKGDCTKFTTVSDRISVSVYGIGRVWLSVSEPNFFFPKLTPFLFFQKFSCISAS